MNSKRLPTVKVNASMSGLYYLLDWARPLGAQNYDYYASGKATTDLQKSEDNVTTAVEYARTLGFQDPDDLLNDIDKKTAELTKVMQKCIDALAKVADEQTDLLRLADELESLGNRYNIQTGLYDR